MGLYSTTRTVNVSTTQIRDIVHAQQKAMELLKRKDLSSSTVKNTFTSYGAAVLGLVFVASTVISVAAGFISLLTSLNASEKAWLENDVKNGYLQLLETHFTMVNGGWASCNMTLTLNKERPGYEFGFIKSRKINSFTTPSGEIAIQN